MLAGLGDDRVKVLRTDRAGVSGARNAGLAAARGEWVFYLDSDNRWSRDFVRLMLIGLEVTGARCGYASLRVEDAEGTVTGYRGEPFDRDICLEGNYVDINVFCHRRDLVKKLGGFDTALRRMVDWDLVLRYTRDNPPLHLPFIGCHYIDEKQGAGRVSTAEPYVFGKIVAEKNRHGHDSAAEALAAVRLDIAVKLGDGEVPEAVAALARAFEDQGHRLRIDRPDSWSQRHPHQDQLVLVGPGAEAYRPHPEQITLALPHRLTPPDAVAARLWQAAQAQVLAPAG
jgi:glycosyltransferase involved in cell wall biosynthesis